MTIAQSDWNSKERLITTQISGNAALTDVQKWEASLYAALKEIPDNSSFKIMVDLHGFKAVDFEVHKAFREIVPRTLSNYGWKVGYLDLFPETNIVLTNDRGIQCKAAVHVHHDETKIKNYDENYSSENERFFTDPTVARKWIDDYEIIEYSTYDTAY